MVPRLESNAMLLQEYSLKIEFPPCDFSAQTVNAIAEFSQDISVVFPYLNAIIDGATYLPDSKILRFSKEGKVVNLYPHMIAIAKLKDREEAKQVIESIRQLINETYARRDEISPRYESRSQPKVRDILSLLPGTNCKQCGLPTCFAFATKLLKGQTEVTRCPAMHTDEYATRRQELTELLEKRQA